MKRPLQILVAESEDRRFLREHIREGRRVRHAASEQECLDLGHAGAGDVMVIDTDDPVFRDPAFVQRMRFVSRSAFPIVGVGSLDQMDVDSWLRAGIAEVLGRQGLTPYRLDRTLRHWVKHHRLQVRLFDANRRALCWWKDLVIALDEMRRRMDRSADSLDAYLGLLEAGDGDIASLRRSTIKNARKQVAEINQLATELDVAARTIELQGIEKTKQQPRSARDSLFTPEALEEEAQVEERSWSIDPPDTSLGRLRRYGT